MAWGWLGTFTSPPDIIPAPTQYLEKLGFPTSMFKFHDVMSTEEWALEMIPRPVLAVSHRARAHTTLPQPPPPLPAPTQVADAPSGSLFLRGGGG